MRVKGSQEEGATSKEGQEERQRVIDKERYDSNKDKKSKEEDQKRGESRE